MAEPLFSPEDRDRTLAHVVDLLSGDERIEAAVLTGSLGRGGCHRMADFGPPPGVTTWGDHPQGTPGWKVAWGFPHGPRGLLGPS